MEGASPEAALSPNSRWASLRKYVVNPISQDDVRVDYSLLAEGREPRSYQSSGKPPAPTEETVNKTVELKGQVKLQSQDSASLESMTDLVFDKISAVMDGLDTEVKRDMLEAKGWNAPATKRITKKITDALKASEHITSKFSLDLDGDLPSPDEMLEFGQQEFLMALKKHFSHMERTADIMYEDVRYKVPVLAAGGVKTVGSSFVEMACGLCCCVKDVCTALLGNKEPGKVQHVLGSKAQGLTGVVKGGSSTLLLGPPGSSKTSFLKLLGGKLQGKQGFEGSVSYEGLVGDQRIGGVSVDKLTPQKWSTFVAQEDQHQAIMTVTETLNFAFACSRASAGSGKMRELRASMAPDRQSEFDKIEKLGGVIVELYLRLLMIYKCKDTIIGTQDGLLKGCSGGERRRVTLGEMLVTGGIIWLCDEISTGLDSNSTKEICIYLKSVAQIFQTTCVVALLQPAPDVIELFSEVILLSEGQIIYHGPIGTDGEGCQAVKSYFEEIGFVCPEQKDIGDFLQDVATSSGLKLLAPDKRAGAPNEATATNQQVANWLGGLWVQSDLYKAQEAHVKQFNCKQESPPAEYLAGIEQRPMPSWIESMKLVLARSWSVRMRNVPVIIGRVIQNIFMGLIFGSLFFQVKDDEWYLKAMLFAQALGFMQSSTIGQINPMCRDRCIFYKHHRQGLYTGTQFALAEWISAFPFTVFDAMIFGNILYWMCGMVYEFEPWALYMLICTCYGVVMNMQINVFVYSMPTESGAFTLAVMFVLLWMVFAGSIATPDVIPAWLKWVYYINPQSWAYQAMAINEFRCAKYDGVLKHGVHYCEISPGTFSPSRCGDFYLKARQFQVSDDYLWEAFYVMGGWMALCFAVTCYVLNNVEHEPPKSAHPDEDSEELSPNPLEEAKTPFLEESATVDVASGLSLPCEPTTLFFHDLNYSVPLKENPEARYHILNEVTGIARPGRMVALMGASGAGKTTLLDVLAGRKTTGEITGDIAINGQICHPSKFAQLVGYVEQFGVHNTTATVFEALVFSAMLRNKSEQRLTFVAEIARMLELDLIADKLVLHCSIEENKRLTIGVEAVANPAVIFLDEPTSGLDARSAMIVMRGMERIARTGRTVLATIHQPNIDIFRMFDGLLLLGKRPTGGFTAFFSEEIHSSEHDRDCRVIIEYFYGPKHRNYVHKLPANYNTATWMLEVIENAGTDGKIQDWPGHWMSEDNSLYVKAHSEVGALMEHAAEGDLPEPYTAPQSTQFSALISRSFTQYWRSPDFSFSRFFVIFFVSALVALIYMQQDYSEAADVQSRVSVIAFAVMLGGIYNLYTIIPFATENRAVFYRERASGMYTNTAYVFSSWVEIPYLVVETALGVNTMYWLIGFDSDLSVWMYFNTIYFLYITAMTYMGMVLSALMPDVMGSQIIAALFVNVCSLFAGSMVPETNIPSYYKFLYWMSPQKWAQEGVIGTQFEDDHTMICTPYGKPCTHTAAPCAPGLCTMDGVHGPVTGTAHTASEYVLQMFVSGYKYDMRNWDLFVLLCWVVAARVLLGIIIHRVNHLKR